jgi:hypothetical protein
MTRDEAIKAMRSGKLCTHSAYLNEKYTLDVYGSVVDTLTRCPLMLTCEIWDDGWEIFKEKKRVTIRRWMGVSKNSIFADNSHDEYDTISWRTQDAATQHHKTVVPVDITFEVEE